MTTHVMDAALPARGDKTERKTLKTSIAPWRLLLGNIGKLAILALMSPEERKKTIAEWCHPVK